MQYSAHRTPEMTRNEKAHMELVRKLAPECVVILENNGILPITKACGIALYGNGARHTVKGGTGSGDVNSRFTVSIYDGLKEAGFGIVTDPWLDRYDKDLAKYTEEYKARVQKYAEDKGIVIDMAYFDNPFGVMEQPEITDGDIGKDVSTAIFVITRDSGEGKDREYRRGDYLLTETEENNLKKVASSYDKTIVLINAGGIIDTSAIKAIPGIDAIVTVSQLGNIGGHVVADVILGKSVPSGKLTDTWAKDYEDYPGADEYSTNNDDEYYKEGLYVGYRYFDSFGIEPMYPFGYGLSYTTFALSEGDISIGGNDVKVSCKVTNTGDTYSGKEVVQVYCSAPTGRIDKPFQVLAGYKKTGVLAPGGSETVTVEFRMTDLVSYDQNTGMFVLEEGDYLMRLGTSSADTEIVGVINVPHTIEVLEVAHFFKDETSFETLTNPGKGHELRSIADSRQIASAKHLTMDASVIERKSVKYTDKRNAFEVKGGESLKLQDVIDGKATVEDLVSQLSVEDMAYICVGAHEGKRKDDTLIGSQSLQVPGAAAETTKYFITSRGIPSLVLADGPAGVRLQPHFKTYEDGTLTPGGFIFGMRTEPFPDDLPDTVIDYYQYLTAIPIATALAQSWNNDLIAELGEMVGEEMAEYNVHLWLAPGMNIHRNPLCGRNFEYYSEDPLISGRCAAAMTNGVQRNKGRGTTIKHFAANNQEDNRLFSNSHVTERTLREIYLRGFEIAVKESQPLSIMTSYNLINGTHAANHFELIQNVLRDEWGFEGVVMTDWCTTQAMAADLGFGTPNKYRESSPALCMHAGNDWIMPGCSQDVDGIVKSVEDGSLDIADLQFCTANILKTCIICLGYGKR